MQRSNEATVVLIVMIFFNFLGVPTIKTGRIEIKINNLTWLAIPEINYLHHTVFSRGKDRDACK